MANENFMRRYIMKFGPDGGKGFKIGNTHSATETALHISFSIEKSDAENPNDAIIQIWNLSNESIKLLERGDCIVELMAGYGEDIKILLVGCVTSAITTQDNADRLTEITVVDSKLGFQHRAINISLNGKVSSKKVYDTIAKEAGVDIRYAKDVKFKNFGNGYSFVGLAKNALYHLKKYNGHEWTMENQQIKVTLPGRAVGATGYLLSASTGLIGIPRRVSLGTGDETQTGWEVQYFLNGAIGINDAVQLESSIANGYFRVQKITMDGDNMEGDWVCTAVLVEIKADSSLDG